MRLSWLPQSSIRDRRKITFAAAIRIYIGNALPGVPRCKRYFVSAPKFAESQLREEPFSVLFLDIDYFKKVNDQFVHAFGNTVLERLATIIKNIVRPQDLCCRYGGEEVVLVLPTAPTASWRKWRNAFFKSHESIPTALPSETKDEIRFVYRGPRCEPGRHR